MATVTHMNTSWTTTGGNVTVGSAPGTHPAAGDILVVITGGSGLVTGTSNVTDDKTGGTYTRIPGASISNSGNNNNHLAVWIRNNFITSGDAGTTCTLTATRTGDTGGGLSVYRVAGLVTTGNGIVVSWGTQTGLSAATPTPVLSSVPYSENAIIAGYSQTSSSTGIVTPRTSYTEGAEVAYSTPSNNLETMFINSGETSASIAWGNAATGVYQAVAVEIGNATLLNVSPDLPLIHALDYRSPI